LQGSSLEWLQKEFGHSRKKKENTFPTVEREIVTNQKKVTKCGFSQMITGRIITKFHFANSFVF
jgi:hypothetical protein